MIIDLDFDCVALSTGEAKSHLHASKQAEVLCTIKRRVAPRSRGDKLLRDVTGRSLADGNGYAVDNDANGWGRWRYRLVRTHSVRGLSELHVPDALQQVLMP